MPVRWQSLVDFLVLAAAIYVLLRWAKQARAVRIALAIIGLHAGALAARNYGLVITAWVLAAAGLLAIAVLLIVFQPELRHSFMRLDTILRTGWRRGAREIPTYRAVADAAFRLAASRVGALIVLVRRDAISELIQGGTRLGAEVSRELLEAVFQKSSPLHDGAVVIDGRTATRARAVLPLTLRGDVPPEFGTRHRAAMGLAERSDAVVVVVSEQRGAVTLMQDRKFHPIADSERLAAVIEQLQAGPAFSWPERLRRFATRNIRYKLAALGLAGGIWAIALFTAGTTVRTITVPVVFTGVLPGANITAQSASDIDVQLRGSPLLMDSAPLERVTATFNLSRSRPGQLHLAVGPQNFDLPPGIRLERATPRALSVRLER